MPLNQIDAFMQAISGQESGGNYQARNPRTGAYGRFQILPSNWPSWSREVFGRVVPRTQSNQNRVAKHKMTQYYRNYGSWDLVAAAWFGGPGAASALKRGDRSVLSRSDGHWTIGKYISEMRKSMQRNINRQPPMYDPSNNRTQPPSVTVPKGPVGYDGNQSFAFYDNLFGSVGRTGRGLVPTETHEELGDDQIGNGIIMAMEEMAKAQTEDGVIDDVDNIAPIFDDADLDEEQILSFDPENQAPVDTPASQVIEDPSQLSPQPGTDPTENPDWWQPLDPLETPFDPSSQSTIMAFQELGQNRALGMLGDTGIPSGAEADFIPPREVASPKQYKKMGGAPGFKAVEIGKRYLGIPYLWGGTNPKKGLDCSGLMQLIFRQMGVNLPRVSRDQARQGKRVASLSQAQPGDLLAYSSARVGGAIGHIAMYVGNGMMLEAPRTGLNVRIVKARNPTVIRRVL